LHFLKPFVVKLRGGGGIGEISESVFRQLIYAPDVGPYCIFPYIAPFLHYGPSKATGVENLFIYLFI